MAKFSGGIALLFIQLVLMNMEVHASSFDFGLNVSRQSLQAELAGETKNIGMMEDDFSVWPVVLLRSSEVFFDKSRWGYSIEFMAGYFDINKQEVNGKQLDLGTSVNGYYGYLTPMLYYRFGDKSNKTKTGWHTTLSIGIGVGYLKVKGDMIMTELSPNRKEAINGEGFGMSAGVYAEFSDNNWFFRISNYAPKTKIGNYDLMLHNVSMIFGRRLDFNLFN